MDIQLIATDLDGTALQNDHKSFSPRLCAAFEEAHRRGLHILPITGRQYPLLPPPLLAKPQWGNLAVLCNGTEVRELNTGKLRHGVYMNREQVSAVIDIAGQLNIPVEASLRGTLYLTKKDWDFQFHFDGLHFHKTILQAHGCQVTNLREFVMDQDAGYEKINLTWIPPERMDTLQRLLAPVGLSCVLASGSSMEVTHAEATKEKGLRRACGLLGIDMDKVMCMGDSGNDASMLQSAGFSVAMGNAPDNIKALAHSITDRTDEDGAAKAIERYALSR